VARTVAAQGTQALFGIGPIVANERSQAALAADFVLQILDQLGDIRIGPRH
jgi:hypothetical protein